MASKFYYFGFGSNMLAKRIHIQNPTAVRIGAGRLENYRLDFYTNSSNWKGAPATIVPTPGSHVYGAVWEIDVCNLKDLDDQESVPQGVYVPITVPVQLDGTDKSIECRAYHLSVQPMNDLCYAAKDEVPYDRQPSKTYLKVLTKGAIETGIPQDYVNWLRSLKHNSKLVDIFEMKLELENVVLKS